MSAHLRELRTECSHGGCPKQATVEAFNTYNSPLGIYCRKHGEEKVRELRKDEK